MEENLIYEWDKMNDYQKKISMLAYIIERALNCYNHLNDFLSIMDTNLDEINYAPSFLAECFDSMRYKLIMLSAKVFDESQDAIGIMKIFNMGEQMSSYPSIKTLKRNVEIEYAKYEEEIKNLRILRDKEYAHTDKKFLLNPIEVETTSLSDNLSEMLNWAWKALNQLMHCTGATLVDPIPTHKDFGKMIRLIKNNK